MFSYFTVTPNSSIVKENSKINFKLIVKGDTIYKSNSLSPEIAACFSIKQSEFGTFPRMVDLSIQFFKGTQYGIGLSIGSVNSTR